MELQDVQVDVDEDLVEFVLLWANLFRGRLKHFIKTGTMLIMNFGTYRLWLWAQRLIDHDTFASRLERLLASWVLRQQNFNRSMC